MGKYKERCKYLNEVIKNMQLENDLSDVEDYLSDVEAQLRRSNETITELRMFKNLEQELIEIKKLREELAKKEEPND